MDVKAAVRKAVEHANEVFANERVTLEEVWFEPEHHLWCVTVGIVRQEFGVFAGQSKTRYHYKTIRLDDEKGEVLSIRNREEMPVSP
jgi:hypothetical protein